MKAAAVKPKKKAFEKPPEEHNIIEVTIHYFQRTRRGKTPKTNFFSLWVNANNTVVKAPPHKQRYIGGSLKKLLADHKGWKHHIID